MNIKAVLGLLLLLPVLAYAQPPEPGKGSTLTIYSDNHERFILVLDGKPQNATAKDDIKVSGLDKQVYDGKIVFEDKTLPILLADLRVTTPAGMRADAFYNIRRTLDGTVELHFLSVVPINEKYLSNDVKSFGHKSGDFIDYTAPIATRKTTKETTVNGKTVTVTSSNAGFDLSGQPIKDKDVKFIDYSAPQAKESYSTTTTTNSKGETITTATKRITPTDEAGGTNGQKKDNKLYVPEVDIDPLLAAQQQQKKTPDPIDLNNLSGRQVVEADIHANYMDIQNSSLTEDKLSNLSKVRDDGSNNNSVYVLKSVTTPQDGLVTTTKQNANGTQTVTYQAPVVTSTVVSDQPTTTVATQPITQPVTTTRTVAPAQNPDVTKYSYSRHGGVTTTTTVTETQSMPAQATTTVAAPQVNMGTTPATTATVNTSAPATVQVTAPQVTQPQAPSVQVTTPQQVAATTTTSTQQPQKTSDVKAAAAAIKGSIVNNGAGQTEVSPDNLPDSKHSKGIKKLFRALSSYDDEKPAAAAPPVSNVDTTIDNGQLVAVVPVTVNGAGQAPGVNTPAPVSATANITPATMATTPTATTGVVVNGGSTQVVNPSQNVANTTVNTTTTTPGVVVMDGNNVPAVNAANYEASNSDGTHRTNNAPCPNPMDVPSFDEAKADISALPDDGTKLSTAMMLENSYCFTSQQVFELCMLFTSEKTKLEFAKSSYSKTVDPNNYFKVNNAFQEDVSVKDLKDFLDKSEIKK